MKNWELIVKFLTNEISDDELKKLNDWLDEDEENKKQLDQAKLLLESSEDSLKTYIPNTANEWEKLKAKINMDIIPVPKVLPLWKKNWWKVAASILLLLGVGFLFKNDNDQVKEIAYINVSTQDSIEVIELPDNSKIHINKNSTIKYPKEFTGTERNVTLIGEAFFEVEADSLHPFIVSAGNTKTKVLGTKFNIKAEKEDEEVEVEVVEGKVEFSDPNNKVILKKHDKVNYHKKTGKINKLKINDQKLKWWMKNLEKDINKLFKKIKKKIK